MKKKTLLVPLAALTLGWACSERAINPLAPVPEGSPIALTPGGPLFDIISNGVDETLDPEAEIMSLNVGGSNRTTQLGVVPTNGDGKNGCNLTGSTFVTFSVTSSNTAVATVTPSSVTFTSCGDVKTLTVTPVTAGTAAISFTETANTTQDDSKPPKPLTFDVTTARFAVNVAPPPNSAPSISVKGVTVGGVYKKGSVPTASCEVNDVEDGQKVVAATLSAIIGPYSADGVGTQTASCSYTDAGGLQAAASVSYQIIYDDQTAPLIASVLDPATPDGTNGWYKSDVTLTWTVNETQSALSLVKTGCVDQNIVLDQAETTYSCSATSDGGSASPISVAIKRDGNAPTAEYTGATPASPTGSNGWYLGDVTAAFKATDNLSGFGDPASLTTTGTANSSGEGAAVTVASPTFTDNAGNTAASVNSAAFKIDKTDPTATADVSPAANGNGWYKAAVTVKFNGSDAGSGIASCTADAIFSAEGASQSASGTCTDNAGRQSSAATVTVSIDRTAPTISGSPTTAANANGWYKDNVSVQWTCADALSGIAACPENSLLSVEGTNLSATASVADRADNSASATVSGINLDKTDPTVTTDVSPAANGNGWHNSNVTVTFSGSDALSGLASCTAPVTMSTEGASQSVPGTCTDKAGRAAPASVTVSIDKTAPTITGAPTTAANGDGWYNSDVSIKWTCVDALSGIVACPVNSLISTEGTNMSAGGSVSDRAGNPASAAVTGINLDKTKPTNVAFIGGTANGGIYYYSFVPAAPTCTANGGLSGLKDCVVSGYSTALGSHTLTATATDRAGNVETATLTYTVNNWTIAGFYQPIDMDGTLNIVKGGFTVPLKFEIFAGNTELTETSAVKGFSAVPVSCSPSSVTDDIEFTTTGGTTLRYDITAGQFVQNWQTPKSSGTCYRATLTTQDGSTKTAYLLLK